MFLGPSRQGESFETTPRSVSSIVYEIMAADDVTKHNNTLHQVVIHLQKIFARYDRPRGTCFSKDLDKANFLRPVPGL